MHYANISSISIGEILVNLEIIEKHTKTKVNISYVRVTNIRAWVLSDFRIQRKC